MKTNYIERIQRHPKSWVPNYGHIHRSLGFTFDLDDFIRGPSFAVDKRSKLSWLADERAEVAGLGVERTLGIQVRPPPIQPAPRHVS